TDLFRRAGALLPPGGVRVQLRDTLAAPDPDISPDPAADEPLLVCIGNPPYDRQTIAHDADAPIARRGGWIRHGAPDSPRPPPLADFLPPADSPDGRHVKNLYNDYVYFWRWALWRVFEHSRAPGVICFVTPASFLRGPGFVAMRRHMRALADELWILDLGGDARGPRRSANVFGVATPVCITLALRRGRASNSRVLAPVWYSRLSDDLDRTQKLARLQHLQSFRDLAWEPVLADPGAPFVPRVAGDPARWPRLDAMFPWHHSGAQWKRTWPIASTPELLVRRWRALLGADDRRALFHESETWTVTRPGTDLRDGTTSLAPIADLAPDTPPPPIVPYAWRAFDRQWCLLDGRLGDRLRPVLWQIRGDRQIYLTTLMSSGLSRGPALVACAHIPDLHYFRGSFGDRGVFPLWRDPAAREPNITAGLLDVLALRLGRPVTADDLCAYIYGCLANLTYCEILADVLAEPGPRVPITADPARFARMAALGARLLRLHLRRDPADLPPGAARCLDPVPEDIYPESFTYKPDRLRVGQGLIAPVAPATWHYEVSGLKIVQAWLNARIRPPRARRSSPLDALRPAAWTEDMTRELLELLWTLEHSLALHAEQDTLLREIFAGPLIPASDLPRPAPGQDRPPTVRL
ncbi:MAG TPA: type ISP restriction/modification enzyme, partial [Nannocystis sp.]